MGVFIEPRRLRHKHNNVFVLAQAKNDLDLIVLEIQTQIKVDFLLIAKV